ncbi:DNA-binding protein [Maricaulis sp.]|uniref:helix-turn-helix domain-containing transcriptional regulator n=1 Tax=Maricaulis sp. TaxID=1486257 RepID=UPI003A951CE3
MPLTRDFKELVKARAGRDPVFRRALYQDALGCFLEGDAETGKAMLRDYVNATLGFDGLEQRTGTPRKSLMRMLSASGNPSLSSIMPIFRAINESENLTPEVRVA